MIKAYRRESDNTLVIDTHTLSKALDICTPAELYYTMRLFMKLGLGNITQSKKHNTAVLELPLNAYEELYATFPALYSSDVVIAYKTDENAISEAYNKIVALPGYVPDRINFPISLYHIHTLAGIGTQFGRWLTATVKKFDLEEDVDFKFGPTRTFSPTRGIREVPGIFLTKEAAMKVLYAYEGSLNTGKSFHERMVEGSYTRCPADCQWGSKV